MEIPADVLQLDEPWERALRRGLDLAVLFSEFRRDPWEAEGRVDAFFCLPRDPSIPLEDSVLVQLPSTILGHRPQVDVVVLVPREVLEPRAPARGLEDADVRLHPRVEDHRRFRLPREDDLLHAGHRGERADRRDGLGRRHEKIKVADGLPHPASASAIAALSMRAWSRMYARISSPIGHATAMRVRDCPSSWSLIASRIFCSVFSPNPFSRRIWRFSAARFRSLMSVIPIVFHSMLARFGPRPRSRITSTSPFGNSRWSLSSASTFPSRRYWSIFSSIACPTPGSCKSRSTPPCRHSFSMSSGIASISRAARRYAIGRNRSPSVISMRSAMS